MKQLIFALAFAAALVVAAEPSGDRPDETHAWAVHDVNRPDPVKVEARPGVPPSDAIVLFDGTQTSVDRHWKDNDGGPSKWTVSEGAYVCTPGSGMTYTAESYADCQLHVEFMTPVGDDEGLGNSGVFLMGCYEIQILDSSAVVPSKSPWKPANYSDGQAGAIYGQHPGLVNPCRKPGEWQTYDIVFHPPRFADGKQVDTGSMTVFFNGVLVQDAWPLEGATCWRLRAKTQPTVSEGPVGLQDHGNPVPFRNIWIRRIPSRYAETTCGGPGVKREDVAKLRHELAAQSLAFARGTDDPAERYVRLWESYCYEPDEQVRKQIDAASRDFVAACRSGDPRIVEKKRIEPLRRFVEMLCRGGWLEKDSAVERAIQEIR